MALPHFRNLISTNTAWEPIYQNLYEVVVSLPPVIETSGSTQILLENAIKVNGVPGVTKELARSDQQFKYSHRRFLQTPSDTHLKFDIDFNINQTDAKTVETWAHMKRWYDLIWNSQTGELHYKQDYIGQLIVHIHDRTGEVIRRLDFVNTFVQGVQGWDFTWESTEIIKSVNTKFICDYWIDTYFDLN